MNEWMNEERLSLFTQTYVNSQVILIIGCIRVTHWMYVCICLTTSQKIDGCHWWQIGNTLIKSLDPKIVLSNLETLHIPVHNTYWVRACCRSMQCTFINSPELWIELRKRNSSALTIRAIRTDICCRHGNMSITCYRQ